MAVESSLDERLGEREPAVTPETRVSFWRRPVVPVLLSVLLVAFPKGGSATGVAVATFTPADAGAMLVVGIAGLRLLSGSGWSLLRQRILLGPVLMVAAAIVTTLWSTNPQLSLVGIVRYAELFCLVPIAVLTTLRDRTDLLLLLGAVVVLGVFEGAVGVFQAATGTGAGFNGQTVRAIGTYGVTDTLAMATVVAVAQVVLMAVGLSARRRSTRLAAQLGAAALLGPILLSLTRGALLASAVAAVAMMLSTGLARTLRIGVVLAAVVVVVLSLSTSLGIGVGGGTVAARFSSIGSSASQPDRSVEDRYDLWSTAVSMWQAHPVTGVGIKQFPAYRDTFAPLSLSSGSELQGTTSYQRGELLSPHNEFLLLLSEQGVLGLGAFLVLQLGLVLRLLRNRAGRPDPRDPYGDKLTRLVAVGLMTWWVTHLLYGDLSGPTAVLWSLLLGVQLRAALAQPAAPDVEMRPVSVAG